VAAAARKTKIVENLSSKAQQTKYFGVIINRDKQKSVVSKDSIVIESSFQIVDTTTEKSL